LPLKTADFTQERLFNRKRGLPELKLNSMGICPLLKDPKWLFGVIATYRILLFNVRIPEGGVPTNCKPTAKWWVNRLTSKLVAAHFERKTSDNTLRWNACKLTHH
jgi:hypothetical protein